MYKPYYQYHFCNGEKIKCGDFGEYRSFNEAIKASNKMKRKMRLSDNWETVITKHDRFE